MAAAGSRQISLGMMTGAPSGMPLTVSGMCPPNLASSPLDVTLLGPRPPPPDQLAVARVGGAKGGAQGGLLVGHHEQVRNEPEGGTVTEQCPGCIEQGCPAQGEPRTQ